MGMKKAALAYQKKGFSVIPISPSNKQPMIKFADKPAMTAQEIEDFWSQYPDSNIAVRTDKFFVIDIDLHGKHNGYESLANWEHLNLITPTLQAKTASGGKHIFYFKHPDVSMTQMIGFLPGVDVKAHPNNYVLVAPSKTPKGEYAWDLEKSKEGGTMVTASRALVMAIKQEYLKKNNRSELDDIYYQIRNGAGKRNRTTEVFEMIVKGFGEEGSRNDTAAKFAGTLLVRSVDPNCVLELARIANNNSADPLSDRELSRTVDSMVQKHMRGGGSDW
ncbi:bifunctional DNA primase/polymerase [Streptococcus suis]|uniref:bifunctional DNA primase/polymerase n=1 Tax=Streptococcus suis TaxID=1307 RepID=UPI001EB616A7|nr:bifunctional DNA primase/polymerase [Streptococcus suis]MBS8054028.1 DNA primase [Streptococcus suis]MCH1730950.1 bifunctional DNA primase/polymerase [Streptococcus suis]